MILVSISDAVMVLMLLLTLEDNFGTGVQASISKPTPFIYLAFEKNGPIHILDHLKCCPIHILPFDFFVPIYCWYLDNYCSHFIEYQKNKQPQKSE